MDNLKKVLDNMKKVLSNLYKKVINFYTKNNSVLATVITITVIAVVATFGIVIVKVFTEDTVTADTIETTAEEATTEEATTEETTTEEATTEETTTEEATTEEPTTVLETIPIEELDIVSNDEAEDFNAKELVEIVEPEPEPEPEPETEPVKVGEVSAVVKGIDVSKWQGEIDWAKVKADGVKFAIIRVGGRSISASGSLYEDAYFRQNIEGALANGIPVGVYFFSQATTVQEAREEASYTLSLIQGYKITYPVVYDWETSSSYRTSAQYISKDTMDAMASTFCDMVSSAGYTPMIYGNTWDLANRYNSEKICSKYKVWIARYLSKYKNTGVQYAIGDPLPDFNYPYQMWQYGSTGRVNGINGNVDMNVGFFYYNGTDVPSTALKFTVKNLSVITNTGTIPNLFDGVSAYNTAGLEATNQVTLTIKNTNGTVVSVTDACNTPGVYSLIYYYKDFTGAGKTINATLTVRSKPVINLLSPVMNYTFDEAFAIKDSISDIIKSNVTSCMDYEGNNLLNNVVITYDDNLNKMISGNTVISGNYTVTYSVTDAKNLSSAVTITISIAPEETTGDDTTGDTTTGDTTTGDTTGDTTTENMSTTAVETTVSKKEEDTN